MKTLFKQLTGVSTSLTNAILVSLAWSGATRFINNFGTKSNDLKEFLALASLASHVTADEIRPTTQAILELISTEPKEVVPSQATIDMLIATGETVESIATTSRENHTGAMARHNSQMAHLERNIEAITEQLEVALNKKSKTINLPNVPSEVEAALVLKMWEKVAGRKARLIDDISLGRRVEASIAELTLINSLLKVRLAA